jgi:hypothetical protein
MDRAVATRGSRWQMGGRRERLRQGKTVAVGCDQSLGVDGKEGVDGSSPSEGFHQNLQTALFISEALHEPAATRSAVTDPSYQVGPFSGVRSH